MAELTKKQYLDLAGLQSYDAKAKARTEAAIKVVDGKVAENAADITTLDTAVKGNAKAIAENAGKIAENTANIASNAAKIAANETAIGEAAQAAATAQAGVDAVKSTVNGMYTNEQINEAIEAAKTAATYDDTEVKKDIQTNADAIAAINNTDTGILKQSKDYTDTTVEAAVEAVKSSLASALTYKGQKATVSELPTEGNKCGDVWSVATTDKGTSAEFVWVVDDEEAGTGHWEELGTAVDLSGYATKQQVATDIATAKGEAIAAAATDATTKANKALEDAKDYADGLAGNYEVAGAAATAEANANDYTDTKVQSVYAAIERIPDADIEALFA